MQTTSCTITSCIIIHCGFIPSLQAIAIQHTGLQKCLSSSESKITLQLFTSVKGITCAYRMQLDSSPGDLMDLSEYGDKAIIIYYQACLCSMVGAGCPPPPQLLTGPNYRYIVFVWHIKFSKASILSSFFLPFLHYILRRGRLGGMAKFCHFMVAVSTPAVLTLSGGTVSSSVVAYV